MIYASFGSTSTTSPPRDSRPKSTCLARTPLNLAPLNPCSRPELPAMAVRLPVIMIHSPPGGSRWQSLGESIIGELIGRPGIDLTLVGRLSDLATGSTDRLTLESLRGDLVVLDWQPPERILSDW